MECTVGTSQWYNCCSPHILETKTTEQMTDLYLTVVRSRYTSSKYRLLKEKKFYDKFVARQTLRVWSKEVAARRPALSADQQRLSKH